MLHAQMSARSALLRRCGPVSSLLRLIEFPHQPTGQTFQRLLVVAQMRISRNAGNENQVQSRQPMLTQPKRFAQQTFFAIPLHRVSMLLRNAHTGPGMRQPVGNRKDQQMAVAGFPAMFVTLPKLRGTAQPVTGRPGESQWPIASAVIVFIRHEGPGS